MLKFNVLVKIKNVRGDIWPSGGDMDCYKGKWGLITNTTSNNNYRVAFLPFVEELTEEKRLEGMNWVFSGEDFEKIEYHCSHCGKLINTKPSDGLHNLLCEDCLENRNIDIKEFGSSDILPSYNMGNEIFGQNEYFLKNLVETSKIFPNSKKKKVLEGLSSAKRCRDCGAIIINPIYFTRDGEAVCAACRNDNYYYCEYCNAVMRKEDVVMGMSGRFYCSVECQEADDPYDFSRELAYNAKPPVRFLGGEFDKTKLYLGVEVEVDSSVNGEDEKEDCIYSIYNTTKDVYCKHDGSLTSGFEFVSHPATLEYHKNNLDYDGLIKTCEDWGYDGDSCLSTGLHIHASRSFFDGKDKEAAIKLEMLFERFWKNILLLSNRTEERAERWAKNRRYARLKEMQGNIEQAVNLYSSMAADRYTAINVQNRPTIEFRIFKGTTRKQQIFAMLEFVDYVCRYVKDTDYEKIKTVSWEEFTAGIAKSTEYTSLKAWLAILNLISPAMVA